MSRCYRHLNASSTIAAVADVPSPRPIVEIREYEIYPKHSAEFWQKTAQSAKLRISMAPLRFFTYPETGGKLHIATHAYYYLNGHSERDTKRQRMMDDPTWCTYVHDVLPYLKSQTSTIWVEAPLVQKYSPLVGGLLTPPLTSNNIKNSAKTIFEIRRYRLKLGYDTVPKFLNIYESGLSSKLNATGTHPTTALVTLLYSEVGRLNEVIEIWKHGDGSTAMEASRQAARNAPEWRSAIAEVANLAIEFTSTIHKPTSFSPMR
jgi:NIPSNAP